MKPNCLGIASTMSFLNPRHTHRPRRSAGRVAGPRSRSSAHAPATSPPASGLSGEMRVAREARALAPRRRRVRGYPLRRREPDAAPCRRRLLATRCGRGRGRAAPGPSRGAHASAARGGQQAAIARAGCAFTHRGNERSNRLQAPPDCSRAGLNVCDSPREYPWARRTRSFQRALSCGAARA